jgi:hypothetical protein
LNLPLHIMQHRFKANPDFSTEQAEAQLAFHSSIQNPTRTPMESDAAASGAVTSNASPSHMDSALLSTLELPDLGGQSMNDW